jgi:hypothetical protein
MFKHLAQHDETTLGIQPGGLTPASLSQPGLSMCRFAACGCIRDPTQLLPWRTSESDAEIAVIS